MTSLNRTRADDIKILVVGDVSRWQVRGQLRDVPEGCEFVDIGQLDRAKIRQYDTALIMTPLMSDGFDAFDVAEKLMAVRFRGIYRVLTNAVPDADIIRADIGAAAPDIDFDLLVLPAAKG